jgi:hypothetical protein
VEGLHKVVHHKSLPYPEIGVFVAELRAAQHRGAGAGVYCFDGRTGEVLGAKWSEIDQAHEGGRVRRVPLTEPALEI